MKFPKLLSFLHGPQNICIWFLCVQLVGYITILLVKYTILTYFAIKIQELKEIGWVGQQLTFSGDINHFYVLDSLC